MRPCLPIERKLWIKFLDEAFGYDTPASYGVDFAPLFDDEALAHSRLIHDGVQIVSSGTLYPKTFITPAGELSIGVIGAVASAASHRGRGYSSQILRELVSLAETLGLAGCVLWSDKEGFYEKLGFAPFGQQEIYSLEQIPSAPANNDVQGELRVGWVRNQIEPLYNEHRLRALRDDRYWSAIDQITSCEKFAWHDETGVARAYAGVGKGKDMQGVIHEWGGDPRALLHLILELKRIEPGLLWLTHPGLREADPVRCAINDAAVPVHTSPLALFHPIRQNLVGINLDKALGGLWIWGLDSL